MTGQGVAGWIFYLAAFDVVFMFFVITPALLFMHFTMPSAVLDRYFKPPHFRDFEIVLFTGIPYAPMRTIMLMRAIGYPSSGKVRGVTEAHTLVPQWYRVMSKIVVISIIIGFAIAVAFTVGGVVFYLVHG